jgi:cobalt-zinc-cadmium efflux system protein
VKALATAFALVAGFMMVEVVAGFATGSLALLSDAGHMATDTVGLGMALAGVLVARSGSSRPRHTYGLYRLEILAALAHAGLLFLVAGYVSWESFRRFGDPPEVVSGTMLIVAVLGLAVNITGYRLLRGGAADSLNIEGAKLEVTADLIGSIGVILAALLIIVADWPYADPLFAAAIGLFILPRAFRLGRRAIRILVEAAPGDLDLTEVTARLDEIPGVVDVHDLHVWTLTSEMDVATAHLAVDAGTDPHPVLDAAAALLRDRYGIDHATLQVEPASHQGCGELAH